MGNLGVARCCQEEQLRGEEFDIARGFYSSDGSAVRPLYCSDPDEPGDAGPGQPVFVDSCKHGGPHGQPGQRCGCFNANAEQADSPMQPLESLSYMPVRFDESSTVDAERSHSRYSKIMVHSTRARTQRRSKAWEDWLRVATAGRAITLLNGLDEASEGQSAVLEKIPAMYHLDRALTKLSILPGNGADTAAIAIMVDSIQVICPATDFMLFYDQVDAKLDESERGRAVLLQYVTEDTQRKRVCFLEDSEVAKDHFVQALTALWLEKRNDHSMWF